MASYVTSVQLFEITIATGATSNTATITSVDTTKAWIWYCGQNWSAGTGSNTHVSRCDLTGATTVTAQRNSSSGTDTATVRGYVFETTASLIASVQPGTISVTATNATGTATVSATTKGVVFHLGVTSNSSTSVLGNFENALDLSGTTVTATRGSTTGTMTVGFVVVDFQSAIIQNIQQQSKTLTSNSTSDTDTISAVTTANTLLIWNGIFSNSSIEANSYYNTVLTNTTTVTLNRTGTSTTSRTIKYTALEFITGVLNVKREGTTAIASAASADSAITSVDVTKALLCYCGFSTTASTASEVLATAKLLDATTVRAQKGVAGSTTSTPAWMVPEFTTGTGIAFDATSNSGYQAAQSSYSWSHTCTGSNGYLAVGVAMLSLAQTVTSITYNSVPLILLGVKSSVSGACRIELWGTIAPTTGSNTIAVTLSGAIASAGCAASYTGVNQTSPTEAFNSAQATNVGAADATVNITTVADNDWVLDIVATDDTAITIGAGNTSRANVTGAGGSGALADTNGAKTPAGSVTMSWTNVGALATWSIGGIALRPVAAANLGGPLFRNSDLSGMAMSGGKQLNPSLGAL